LSMNIKGVGSSQAAIALDTAARVKAAGFDVSVSQMDSLAQQIGEKTLFGRTGGAATLAVGMAQIFSRVVSGRWLDLWYHFAIMFEALFILTTLDAGTRVGRYLIHDVLGNLWKPLGDTKRLHSNLLASSIMVSAWGYFLIQGVRDPLGGINSLWPLFGIANQLLASVALCLATTIILKKHLLPGPAERQARPVLALVTFIPLVWLLAATMTAGGEKIFHPKPSIGFLAKAAQLDQQLPGLRQTLRSAEGSGQPALLESAGRAVLNNRREHFNQVLDAVVAGVFLILVVLIVLLSIREWVLLLARKRRALLHETEPVWLPDYARVEARPAHLFSLLALAFALAKELSGEAQVDRLKVQGALCGCHEHPDPTGSSVRDRRVTERAYLRMTERRFDGVTRCC
jgi:carbon starvation protein